MSGTLFFFFFVLKRAGKKKVSRLASLRFKNTRYGKCMVIAPSFISVVFYIFVVVFYVVVLRCRCG
jgi:hypothetical protein